MSPSVDGDSVASSEATGATDPTEPDPTEPDATEAGSSTTGSTGSEAEESALPRLFEGEFETLSGETFDVGSLEGQDVVLWFWAPW